MVGFKTAALAAGAGSVVLGGGGLALWGLGTSPSQPKNDSASMGVEYDLYNKRINFGSYGCFSEFFPGAEIKHNFVKKEGEKNIGFKADSLGDLLKSSSDPEGCANMNFSYVVKTDTEHEFSLKAEVTVRNDRFGWALWVGGGEGALKEGEQQIAYRLVFLRKENNVWSVVGGYGWLDQWFANYSNTSSLELHIKPPLDSGEDWGNVFRGVNGYSKGTKHYSGKWGHGSDSSNKDVFEGIEIFAGNNRSKSVEILGLGPKEGKTDVDFVERDNLGNMGYMSASYFYSKEEGWLTFKTSQEVNESIDEELNKLYAPFKGKKGKWKEAKPALNKG